MLSLIKAQFKFRVTQLVIPCPGESYISFFSELLKAQEVEAMLVQI